jgi:hypothetical protein
MASFSEDYEVCSENGDDVTQCIQLYGTGDRQGNLPHGFEIGSYESNKPMAGSQG